MKKIADVSYRSIFLFDSTDYIKIEKDDQYVDDKYVDYYGKKFNEYNRLYNGQLIIRDLYCVLFDFYDNYRVCFKKYKHYGSYYGEEEIEFNKALNTKNSVFNNIKFDVVKHRIVNLFSRDVEIKIL